MKNLAEEPQYPETYYEREVGQKAFRTMVLKTLLGIDEVYFLEEDIVDSFLGREGVEGVRGLEVELIENEPALCVKIQVCLGSGCSIPAKVEEIQTKVVQDLTQQTGLHVSRIQVTVEDIRLPDGFLKRLQERLVGAIVKREQPQEGI